MHDMPLWDVGGVLISFCGHWARWWIDH